MREVSLAAGTLLLDACTTVTVAAEAGYAWCGLRPLDDELSRGAMMARRIRAEGVGVLDVEVVRIGEGEDRYRTDRLLDFAAEVGARGVVTVVDDGHEGAMRNRLALLVERAHERGTTVLVEYMVFTAVRTLAHALALTEALPEAAVMIDVLHHARAGGDRNDFAGRARWAPRRRATLRRAPCRTHRSRCARPRGAPRTTDARGGATAPGRLAHGIAVGYVDSVEVQSDTLRGSAPPAVVARRLRHAAGAVLAAAGRYSEPE